MDSYLLIQFRPEMFHELSKKMISQFTVKPNTWGTVLKNVGTKWNSALFCSLSLREKTQQNQREMMDKTYDGLIDLTAKMNLNNKAALIVMLGLYLARWVWLYSSNVQENSPKIYGQRFGDDHWSINQSAVT